MNEPNVVPNNLKLARRKIEEIPNVRILRDWVWDETNEIWVLYCELTIAEYIYSPFLPQVTNWYVVASSEYPLGNISFFPSKKDGLEHTFQHQLNNTKIDNNFPWRPGSICLDLNVKVLGRLFTESELFSSEERLAWYFRRALNWLRSASHGEFTMQGEPFELPDFSPDQQFVVAFSESASSFDFWMNSKDWAGTVSLTKIERTLILATKAFYSIGGKQIMAPNWGKVLDDTKNEYYKGLWIRLEKVPILKPWQAPSTYGELIEILKSAGLDFYEVIKPLTQEIRDGAKHFLLLGFPIPPKYGEAPIRMHWQSILLPKLSSGSKTMNGFRPNQHGKFLRDKVNVINATIRLDWIISENWDREQVSVRGRFPDALTHKRILVIGCGAVGSVVAELLVRGGVIHITLIDGEVLEVGNLVRHTLSLRDVKKPKAQQLAEKLNTSNPNSKVDFIAGRFPPKSQHGIDLIKQCDVIIDCTADDKVLRSLPQFPWDNKKLIVSLALNYGATKLIVFTYRGKNFPLTEFSNEIEPYLTTLDEIGDLPSDGIGCWHPVFPARADDVWLLVSAGVKEILARVQHPLSSDECKTIVFEQKWQDNNFMGVRKV